MKVKARDLNELIEKMEENDIDTLADIDNVAMKPVTNQNSKVILLNDTGEAVFVQEVMSAEKKSNLAEYEIQFDPTGKPYFQPGRPHTREYIGEFLLKNFGGDK